MFMSIYYVSDTVLGVPYRAVNKIKIFFLFSWYSMGGKIQKSKNLNGDRWYEETRKNEGHDRVWLVGLLSRQGRFWHCDLNSKKLPRWGKSGEWGLLGEEIVNEKGLRQ
jgi:hypothetical protein